MKSPDQSVVNELGKTHLYTGSGKGKTTALIGLAVRASGYRLKTCIGQFMKGRKCGEHVAIGEYLKDYIEIEQYGGEEFLLLGKPPDERDYQKAQDGLIRINEKLHSGKYHLVMLDEVCVAVSFGLLMAYQVVELIQTRPKRVELIVSGRWAHPTIIAAVDLVTEMTPMKHYFDQGVNARKGIEE